MSIVLDRPTDTPSAPGLYADIQADRYHRWPYASQSILKIIRDKSPAHAKEQMDNPTPPTPALKLGTAVHTAVLQPDLFPKDYVVAPKVDRRTKAGKEAWTAFEQDHPFATILTADEYQQCMAMRDSVAAHPIASKLLEGNAEISAVWKDAATGVLCKGRFDDIAHGVGAVVDVKTTLDASPRVFMKAIWNYAYFRQAAMYLQGAQSLGIDANFFTIIAIEKAPPYAVAVYHIKDEAIKAGADELKPLLETYARCQESGVWPGYAHEAVEIDLPRWGYYQLADEGVI